MKWTGKYLKGFGGWAWKREAVTAPCLDVSQARLETGAWSNLG